MTEPCLMYYNWNESRLPLKSVIQEACQREELKLIDFGKEWTDCSIGIFHGEEVEVKIEGVPQSVNVYQVLSKSSYPSATGLVVFWISSSLISNSCRRVHFDLDKKTKGVRYLLPVRMLSGSILDPRNEKSGEKWEKAVVAWQTLFQLARQPAILDKWFDNPYRPTPYKVLNELFLETEIAYLAALRVLCFGYLAVQVDNGQNLLEDNFLLYATEIENVSAKQTTVSKLDWWRRVFDKDQKAMEEILAYEWDVAEFAHCPESLQNLLNAIYNGSPTITPQIVKAAYQDILQRAETA